MLKRIVSSIGTVLVIGLLVVAAGVVWFFHASPYKTYVIHTGSMGQTIPSGSAVIVRKGEYHVGQPVTFKSNGQLVTHRLIGIDANGNITTKGDANRTVDASHPPKSNIIGGVVHAPRYLGRFIVFLAQRTAIPGVLLVFFAFWLWPPHEELESEDSETRELVATSA